MRLKGIMSNRINRRFNSLYIICKKFKRIDGINKKIIKIQR